MIQRIGASVVTPRYLQSAQQNNLQAQQNTVSTPVKSTPAFNYTATQLVNAYQAFHGITPAKTVSFGHLSDDLKSLRTDVYTCQDVNANRKGEKVGQRWLLTPLSDINSTFVEGDTQSTNFELTSDKTSTTRLYSTIEKSDDNLYQFGVLSEKTEKGKNNLLNGQVFDIAWKKALITLQHI